MGKLRAEVKTGLPQNLLRWYRANRRDLPWRRLEDDPYAVWISEVMLQQTQVRTVIPYFERWMTRFPTLRSLADAPLEEALRLWAGLGYYARARNLHRAAQTIMQEHGGRIPCDAETLSRLPGIGRYTLGAMRSIAYNQPAPIVDANVARVLSRVYAVEGDPKSSENQARLWELAEVLIPPGEARDFNQALMELGALICTPFDPACERCPILPTCIAGNSPDPTAWPQIPPGKRTVRATHSSAIIVRDGKALLIRRHPHGLWGGLWELPRRVCSADESPPACAMRAAREVMGLVGRAAEPVGVVKHSVTHHAITLHGILLMDVTGQPACLDCAEFRWIRIEEELDLPLSSPQNLLLQQLRGYLGVKERQSRLALTI